MDIRKIPIGKLKPYAKNPRKVTSQGLARLRKQIEELHVYQPLIVAAENNHFVVLGGNQRLKVFEEMGIKEVDCSVVDAPDESTRLKYCLSANDQIGVTDVDLLGELLRQPDIEVNMADYQVDTHESISLHNVRDQYEARHLPENVDEIPSNVKTRVKLGEIWQCGNHKVMCGDSTKREDVKRLMSGEKAHLFLTDPPYGVSYGDKNKFLNAVGRGNRIQENIENDCKKPEEMRIIWTKVFRNAYEFTTEKAAYYINAMQAGDLMMMMMMSIEESGWLRKQMIIWVKNNIVLGRSDYNYQHEPIFYGWKKSGHNFYGEGGESSVWRIDKPMQSKLHPTMKPVELCARAIKNSSRKGEIVLDLFAGSGSTLIACETLGRRSFNMEIDEKYCSVTLARWEEFIHAKAKKLS